jgi:hypothetical protein
MRYARRQFPAVGLRGGPDRRDYYFWIEGLGPCARDHPCRHAPGGTLASSAFGRVTHQIALTKTRNDNGFVSMFLLLVPA